MAFARPLAYNTGSLIPGTEQIGNLSIGAPTSGFTNNPQYWNGPDEELGYVIAQSVSGNTQPTPIIGVFASLGFFRSTDLTEGSFIALSETIAGQSFATGEDAKTWLNNNGYWTSYVPSGITPTPTGTLSVTSTPTQTPTNTPTGTPVETPTPTGTPEGATPTPTGTPVETPTHTGTPEGATPTPTGTPEGATPTPTGTPVVTPTSTDLTIITTYTISGCTSLNEFVANLGPGALAPGDIFYFEFTGGTPSGCYRIVNKINAVPTDGTTPLYFYTSCALCVAAREVTPTPTVTQTPTTSPVPVTGYGYNLVVLPYNAPTSGNTIFPTFATPGLDSGTTNPNTFTTNGVYWNTIDNSSVDRTNYYSGMTGVSVTAYFTQNGDTAIYSGSTTAFTFDGPPGQQSFNYNPNIVPGQLALIQSASTNFVTGQTVYISYVVN